ncbi:hypothetical protein M758_4G262200 [Ceratodon purpureus]|nr:hypothetical protein M758_4G262200 [Ceratodon purpureus]
MFFQYSREKIRPEQELKRAEAQILRSKLAIREAIHELDDLGLEGSLDEHLFDDEGRIYHEEIFCAKCKSQEALLDNDIILCDGACNRGFHQFCLDPPLETKDIPPGDEGWLCPVCDCKMECIEAINGDLGTNYEVENSWEEFFSKEAAGGGSQAGGDWPSSDSEDNDYEPEDSKDSPVAATGVTEVGIDVDWPSTDSEDDDFDPERGEKKGDSEEESESEESGDDREDGEDGADSDSDSDFKENEPSSGSSDKDEKESVDKDEKESMDTDEKEPSGGHINLKKLARKGKRRRSSSHEENESSQPSDSDDSDVSLFDEFKNGGGKLGRRDSEAEVSVADENAMVIEGKRHRKALDYKKLHDELYGNTEVDDDDVASEDEDWGPKRRRRRTIPDDPSRPRPSRVRRRNSKASSGDTSREVDADTKEVDVDTSKGLDPDASKRVDADASEGVDADASMGTDVDASKGADADGVPMDLPFGSQGGDGGDREKRMWRRLPDTAVEALRRVVAVTTLPSKSRKEELAAELGLSFTQVHGWFKNQRHQALRKGLEKPKRPHLVASSSKGVHAVNDVETSASREPATEITIPQNENCSKTVITEKLEEEQSRLPELEHSLGVVDKDSVLVMDTEGRIRMDNNFGNGGIGLPEDGNRVFYVPAVTEVREQPPVTTHTST